MSVALSENSGSQDSVADRDRGLQTSTSLLWISWKPILHLLWREWRILRWWLVASLAITSTTMMLCATFLGGQHPTSVPYSELLVLLYLQSFIAPGTFLIGALSSSFANDREDTSFQWCTSLPVHWTQSIIVKLFISCSGALVCWWIALLLATLIGATIRPIEPLGVAALSDSRMVLSMYASPVVFTFFFVTYSLSLIGIQICRHATNGVFLAIFLSITFLILWLVGISEYSPGFDRESSLIIAIATIFSPLICGCLFLAVACWLYRWRWYRGMYSNVAPTNYLYGRQTITDDSIDSWPLAWSVPNQQQALFWLAWKKAAQAWWWVPFLVWIIFLGTLMRDRSGNVLIFLVPLGFLLLATFIGLGSIWSFYGERGGEAESFLAERGVSPTRHWWSRYLVSTIGGTLVFLGAMYLLQLMDWIIRGETIVLAPQNIQLQFLTFLIVGVHAFTGVCLLAGQTFRRWQLAIIAVAFGAIVFTFCFGSAVVMGGYFGGLFCFGLGLSAIPLSWCLSKQAAVRWQPNLDWVFPLFATVVVTMMVCMMPWVRIWVLPPPVTELSVGRAIPSFTVPNLSPHNMQPLLSREVLFAWTDVRTVLATTNADELGTAAEELRPQLKRCLEQAQNSSTPMNQAQISDVRNAASYFNSLGSTAFAALEIGDAETAALSLKLRVKILTDLRPISGLFEFDSLQVEFLEALGTKASVEALQLLRKLIAQDERLLSDSPEQARTIWAESIEAQASFLYRNGDDLANNPRIWLRPINSSDSWLAETRLGNALTTVAGIGGDFPLFELWPDLEKERFRREISFAYRNFQIYLNTGKLTPGLSRQERLDLGSPSFNDCLSGQVADWDRQWKALARLEARLKELPTE